MRPPRHGRARRAVALAAASCCVGGVAVGAWAGAGAGSGSASTGAPLAVTIQPGTPSAALVPGGTAAVALTISNPNPFTVRVGRLSLATDQGSGGFAVDGGHSGCGLGVLSMTAQTNGGAGWTVPARTAAVDGSLTVTLTGALAMGTAAASACQGAIFTVYLTAGA